MPAVTVAQAVRIADTICMLSAKLHHHDERRHHIEKQIEFEADPAQQPRLTKGTAKTGGGRLTASGKR